MDLANLAMRLRVAGNLEVSTPSLIDEAIRNLARFAPIAVQRQARNRCWRQAALLVQGSRWAKASRLLWELGHPDAPPSEFRRLVLEGVELSPRLRPPTTMKAVINTAGILPSLHRSIQSHIGLNMKLNNTANVKGIKIALAR